MNQQILRYITANRDTYTREAITRRLTEAGHDPAEIEQAWESIEPRIVPRSEGGLPEDIAFWFTIYVVVLYGLTFVVYALGIGELAIILGIFLLLGAMVSTRMVRSSRVVATAVAKGVVSGLLIAALIPFVFLVIIAGLCTAMVRFPL